MTTPGGPAPSYESPTVPHVVQPAGSAAGGGWASDSTGLPPDRPGSRLPVGLSVLGGSLVLATILVAGTLVENRPDDFNWSAFVVGLVGTVLLLAAAAAVVLLGRGLRSGLPAVLGSFGLVGVAILWLSWLTPRHENWPVYVAGAFLIVTGALGWWLLRGSALLLVAGLGGLLLLAQVVSDTVDGSSEGDGRGLVLWVALAFAAYGVAFAAGLWWLPSRHVTGLTGIALALVSVVSGMYLMIIIGAFEGVSSYDETGNPIREDVSVSWYAVALLVIGLVLCAAALAIWARSGHLGYAVLGALGAVSITSAGAFAVAPDATLRWVTGLGVVGLLVLVAGLLLALQQHRSGRGGQGPDRAGDPVTDSGR